MSSKNLYDKPFDEGTIIKLQIFQKYFKREPFKTVIKKEGQIQKFHFEKIIDSIFKAAKIVGGTDYETANSLTNEVVRRLSSLFPIETQINTEDINKIVERVLMERGHRKTAKAYIEYRYIKYST